LGSNLEKVFMTNGHQKAYSALEKGLRNTLLITRESNKLETEYMILMINNVRGNA
jgi:hypothetical protein